MKPFTPECYDEHLTDDDYRPVPPLYVLYVQEEEGGAVRWAQGPIREDLWKLAPRGCACWIVTEK